MMERSYTNIWYLIFTPNPFIGVSGFKRHRQTKKEIENRRDVI